MIVRCTNCATAYSVADEKVSGKKFAFGCPNCGTNVIIDNRSGSPAAPTREEPSFADIAADHSTAATAPADDFDFGGALGSGEEASDFNFDTETASGTAGGDFSFDEEPTSTATGLDAAPFDENDPFAGITADEGTEFDDDGFNDLLSDDDEIEPEIDLSVLNRNTETSSAAVSGISESSFDEASDTTAFPFDAAGDDEDDEKITIDLDKLDLPFETEGAEDESISMNLDELAGLEEENPYQDSDGNEEDESLTLDLDSLDLDLEESDEVSGGDVAEDSIGNSTEEDESLTLDLSSLDLDLEESEEVKTGESDDDTRLTLGDAGLSLDEIESAEYSDGSDDDLKLSLDDIDAGLIDMEGAEESADTFGELITDEYGSEAALPEIDMDRFQDEAIAPATPADSFLEISDEYSRYENDVDAYGTDEASGSGYVNFSIDYSMAYSRLGALLRILGLFQIVMIPHYAVLMIYSLLSAILAPINQILILVTGAAERDYMRIHEKLLRYATELGAVAADLAEELPPFAGNRDMDYQIQMNIVRPERYSRLLAFLRLTVVGIVIAGLPHILLLAILACGASLMTLAGLFAVLVTGRWPGMIFDFLVRYFRYSLNVSAYLTGVVDTYPSFRFD